LNFVHIVLLAAQHAQKNKTLNKHLTSKLQVSPNFTLDSVTDSNYRGKCDVGGFLIFEWTLALFRNPAAIRKAGCILHVDFQTNFCIGKVLKRK
jgi:hypothetical protein